MAVVWIRERYGNSARRDATTGSYRRLFWLRVADPTNDREHAIINDPLVMPYLSGNWSAGTDFDPTVRVDFFQLDQIPDHPEIYSLEIEYVSVSVIEEDPTAIFPPPDWDYSWVSARKPIWAVWNDAEHYQGPSDQPEEIRKVLRVIGVTNSAKQPFEQQPEYDDHRLILTITRSQLTFSPSLALLYAGSVNVDFFMGAAPGQCLMLPWKAKPSFAGGLAYWRVTYEIHHSLLGWWEQVLDEGGFYYPGGYNIATVPQVKRDADGTPITLLLDGTGDKLEVGETEQFLYFHPHHRTLFNLLALPPPPNIV